MAFKEQSKTEQVYFQKRTRYIIYIDKYTQHKVKCIEGTKPLYTDLNYGNSGDLEETLSSAKKYIHAFQ